MKNAIIVAVTAQPDCGMILAMEDHEEALKASTRRYRRTKAAHDDSRKDSTAAVVAALNAGVPPTKVADLSPFTATQVRKIARDAGIPPARKGQSTVN